jgi:beta-N-acetylhexosaminidase
LLFTCNSLLTSLPLEQQIGQLLFIGFPGTADAETRSLIEHIKPGGVIRRNVASPEQLRKLLDDIRDVSKVEPLFGIDQEGGLGSPAKICTPMPSARTIRQHGDLAGARARRTSQARRCAC